MFPRMIPPPLPPPPTILFSICKMSNFNIKCPWRVKVSFGSFYTFGCISKNKMTNAKKKKHVPKLIIQSLDIHKYNKKIYDKFKNSK